VQINVSPGQNSNTIATNMRDACNANVTLIGLGYSARLIYAPTGLARLKLTGRSAALRRPTPSPAR
jgi:hypothetical protein